MSSRVQARLDLNALEHNLSVLRQQVADSCKLLVMVKANAYGHKISLILAKLSAADGFGVATLDEGIELRELGVTQPIVVMGACNKAQLLEDYNQHDLTLVVSDPIHVKWLLAASHKLPLKVWLKIDSGMNRLGIKPDAYPQALQQLQSLSTVQQPICVMTHLANADDNAAAEMNSKQLDTFKKLTDDYIGPKSVCSSAGIFNFSEVHHQWCRPGITIYGISPFSNRCGADLGLRPVMELSAEIVAVRHCQAGERIGYGSTYQCPEAMPVAVVGIGYGDGYPRHIVNGTPVLINGVECPIVGRVSMDMLTVDLRPLAELPHLSDRVILWGPQLPIERIAKAAGTIAYELCCQLTRRVSFVVE